MEKLLAKLKLDNYAITKTTIGRSVNEVYKLNNFENTIYLKIGNELVQSLGNVLEFLGTSTLNVPKLIDRGTYKDSHYVLMSECSGTMAHEINPELAVKVLAKGLKQIHSIDLTDCKIIKDALFYKSRIIENIKREFNESELKFIKDMELLDIQNDLVFTHGDYSLPNILYDNGKVSFIDLDYAGVSFRYLDILDCLWSINYNFGNDKYEKIFLKEYGISELDMNKVESIKKIHRLLKIKGYQ